MFSKSHIHGFLAAALCAAATPLSAHIEYTGRDFGGFTPGGATNSVTISSNKISSNYGWADGTDADFGDSHKLLPFRFTLLSTGLVTLQIQGSSFRSGVLNVPAMANPGFSIYRGLAHLPPLLGDHDTSGISSAYNDATYGAGKWEGSFNALGDWKIGNDDGNTFADLSSFTYFGNAADGSSTNFGNAAGINGDGLADSYVQGSFLLGPGDYSIFVGGADYYGVSTSSFGFNATLSVAVIPEPSTYALFAVGAMVLAAACRRRMARG